MIDIKLIDNTSHVDFDYDSTGDFDMQDGFDTAILMSLFCEQRADESEVADPMLRRGWIGNSYYNEDGYENGSKVWVHTEQGRITNLNLNKTLNAAQNGVNWFVDDEILNKIETSIASEGGKMQLAVTFEYDPSQVETRYYDVWKVTGD